ncbi:hypothetical protein AAFP35_03970 [Gordonia sp. CPCC 206044]|uniref:hypothetical protein n=1 Tax=Gordonia sp. CPCC 206044 TaxID=3140793 RepID=UPI003AF40ABF
MQEEEPSILASLGIDPTTLTEPAPDVWEAALAAAFDPAAQADPDTVPEMDDTPPDDLDDEIIVDDADHPDHAGPEHHADTADVHGGAEPVLFDDADDPSFDDHIDHGDTDDLSADHHHEIHDEGHHDL